MSKRKGFALVEILVAILTVCICIPILVSVIEMRLSVVNQNLIVQPGTQIFLMDIETALFYLEGDSVMLRYVRDQQEYEVYLCKQ